MRRVEQLNSDQHRRSNDKPKPPQHFPDAFVRHFGRLPCNSPIVAGSRRFREGLRA
jgi:hypothetical protein